MVAFVLLRKSRFSFHCYTQCQATPTQKSARKWRCDISRLLAQKITKGIHSCKPASLNCLTEVLYMYYYYYNHDQNNLVFTFTVSISLKSQSEFWQKSLKFNPFFFWLSLMTALGMAEYMNSKQHLILTMWAFCHNTQQAGWNALVKFSKLNMAEYHNWKFCQIICFVQEQKKKHNLKGQVQG